MKKIMFLLMAISLFACTETPKPPSTVVVNADTLPTAASIRTLNQKMVPDTLVIELNAKGGIKLGKQELNLEQLEAKLVDSLKFLQKTYGKMPDTIIYHTTGDVLMGMRGAVKDAIFDAQEKVRKN